jgi:hypothetical protein
MVGEVENLFEFVSICHTIVYVIERSLSPTSLKPSFLSHIAKRTFIFFFHLFPGVLIADFTHIQNKKKTNIQIEKKQGASE